MKYLISIAFSFLVLSSFAQLRLAKIFSDNMILQRDVEIPVWGWADKGSQVSVIFDGQTYNSNAPNGTWKINLPARPAGNHYELTINNLDTIITFKNITFGDIWLCGGQSNMEWFVQAATNGDEEVQQANYPNIRLFEVPHNIASRPVHDLAEGSWQICTPNSVKQFSAVGYFFGRELHKELKIPVGLLSDNFGGTVIETWMSPDAFKDMPIYLEQIAQLQNKKNKPNKKVIESKFKAWLARFSAEDKGKKGETYPWKDIDYSTQSTMTLPTQWESAGIKNLEEMNGVIWFEKEFILTENQAQSTAKLSLGPIDDSDITWINGQKIGETSNRWNKDRNYSIPKNILKSGKNKIVVRIEDYLGGGGIYGKESQLFLELVESKESISLSGKWHFKVGYTTSSPMPMSPDFGPNSAPTLLYNGMIFPIQKYPIKGVIWYQGETNTYRAAEYKTLKTRWIHNWRQLWKNPDMPIIWVQLANYQTPQTKPDKSIWAELREAQQEALSEPNTAMISAIDLGEAKTIHPLNKQEVGRRLALAAFAETYKKPKIYKSPRFKSYKKKRKFIDITFEDVNNGLATKSKYGYVTGFTIAAKDQKFHWAQAKIITPNKIRVYTPKGIRPAAVRYAWANNPDPANITNSEGFPLLPFRTDDWKLSTEGITR